MDLLQNLTFSLIYVENEMQCRHQDLETLKYVTKELMIQMGLFYKIALISFGQGILVTCKTVNQ